MSALINYRRYAPFTADKLIDAANSILTSKGAQLISKRTLRFYTAQGVVPHPLGSPKFARYGYEHLLTLLASRTLQDQGLKLEQIAVEVGEIRRGQFNRLETVVENWLDQAKFTVPSVAETRASYGTEDMEVGEVTRRIRLSPNTVLEVRSGVSVKSELEGAIESLRQMMVAAEAKAVVETKD